MGQRIWSATFTEFLRFNPLLITSNLLFKKNIISLILFTAFPNNFGQQSTKTQAWPRPQQPSLWNIRTPTPSTVATLPPMTPKNIPEQLRILGFNTLAALIARADLTKILGSRGPFTVFAPTDKAFNKFIGNFPHCKVALDISHRYYKAPTYQFM